MFRNLTAVFIVSASALVVAGCAPDTLPPMAGSPAAATPTTGGSLAGVPEPALQTRASRQNGRRSSTRYECDTGHRVVARYPDTDHAVIRYKKHKHKLHIAMSADGARYVGHRYEWWTRGIGRHARASLYVHKSDGSTGRLIAHCRPDR